MTPVHFFPHCMDVKLDNRIIFLLKAFFYSLTVICGRWISFLLSVTTFVLFGRYMAAEYGLSISVLNRWRFNNNHALAECRMNSKFLIACLVMTHQDNYSWTGSVPFLRDVLKFLDSSNDSISSDGERSIYNDRRDVLIVKRVSMRSCTINSPPAHPDYNQKQLIFRNEFLNYFNLSLTT